MSGPDECRGLLRKAENDLAMAEIGIQHGAPLDTVCFHLQQTAEKLLKALLSYRQVPYRLTHDLSELLDLAAGPYPALGEFEDSLAGFTPYAVRMRYDEAAYPDEQETMEALETVKKLRSVILDLLSPQEK